jgi:predicted O-methyltransferase YrrM
MKYARTISRIPVVGVIAVFAYRATLAGRHLFGTSRELLRWWLTSNETSNFTYDLTPLNKAHLAALVAHVTARSYQEIAMFMSELDADSDLRSHVREIARAYNDHQLARREVEFGRRLGWYAIARALKPRVVVETGVAKGLGSCVLTAALARNSSEGHPGRYYGLDINPSAGYLLAGKYKQLGEILYGDAIASLRRLDAVIDLFINDSDHSPEYEMAEYRTVAPRLGPNAILLGDNSHVTDQLLLFARATDRQFVFFRETPLRHWYPGAGIGIAFNRIIT